MAKLQENVRNCSLRKGQK